MNNLTKDIALVIFDYDGTIGDTRKTIVATMQQTLKDLGFPQFSEEACASTIGLPLKECFRKLLPYSGEEELDGCAAMYRRLFDINKERIRTQAFPNVGSTLESLRHKGLRMSIATSRGVPSLKAFLEDMGFSGYFDLLLGADEVRHHKPDPEPVLLTLETLGFKPSQALVVGDMPVDILMGLRAGCLSCGVTYGNSSRAELEAAGADFIIDDFGELTELL